MFSFQKYFNFNEFIVPVRSCTTSVMNGLHTSDLDLTEDEFETEIMLYDRSTRRVRHQLTRVASPSYDNYNDEEPLMQREPDRDGKYLLCLHTLMTMSIIY